MTLKAELFGNSDLRLGDWSIRANAQIIEMHCDKTSRKVVSGKLTVNCWLDPTRFRVVLPSKEDQIKDYICFEFTTNHQPLDHSIYVHESDVIFGK